MKQPLFIILTLLLISVQSKAQLYSFQIRNSDLLYGNTQGYSSNPIRTHPTTNTEVKAILYFEGGEKNIEMVYVQDTEIITLATTNFHYSTFASNISLCEITFLIPPNLTNGVIKVKWESGSTVFYSHVAYMIDNTHVFTTPLFRFRHNEGGGHLYTTNSEEIDWGASGQGLWSLEAYLGFIYKTQKSGTVPVYRYFRSHTFDHYYTLGSSTPPSYVSEGVVGYAFSYQAPNTIPIYGYWNGKHHFLTNDFNELGNGKFGYAYEGISFYLLSK